MKTLLIISFSNLSGDPRVNRQIRLLRDHYRVVAAGYEDPDLARVEFLKLPRVGWSPLAKARAALMLKAGMFERFYWSSAEVGAARSRLTGRTFDLILANEVNTLPLAIALQPVHGVVLDAHEYSPRELEDDWKWRFFFQPYVNYLCAKYIPQTAGMVTVCDGIAEEFGRNFGVTPAVVYSAPYRVELTPRPAAERSIRLVHHGGAIPSRKIETMISMMAQLDDRFSLDFYLAPTNTRYLASLKRMAHGKPRVRILPPAPMAQLPEILNAYDVGVYILEPNNFNNEHALPNKLFEFIQGRIAVAIGPSPEMARLVRRYNCGVVAQDFTPAALASELASMTPARLNQYKRRADAAAHDLCYEETSQALLRVLSAAVGSRG